MQNFDYSKKYKKNLKPVKPVKPAYQEPKKETPIIIRSGQVKSNPSPIMQLISKHNSQPLPFIYLFIGAVLFFTSGLLIGLKIDQKENSFANNEYNSFKNISSEGKEAKSSDSEEDSSNDFEESGNSKDNIKSPLGYSSVPKNLQFPPKLNQVNYIIQLGSFSREEATKLAASLIRERQEFQGRIFRTTTGKLYLGYYYELKEAKAILRKVKKLQKGAFEDSSIKNIQF